MFKLIDKISSYRSPWLLLALMMLTLTHLQNYISQNEFQYLD